MPSRGRRAGRRRRVLTRAVPVAVLAGAAFAVGIVSATGPGREERRLVVRYLTAWAGGDYGRMYGMLDPSSRARLSLSAFTSALTEAASTATMITLHAGRIGPRRGDLVPVAVTVDTRLFGRLAATLELPLAGRGAGAGIRYSDRLLFPGVRPGERLSRLGAMPPRADLLARDGTPLAAGPDRTSPIPDVAAQIAGTLGPIPALEAATYEADGYPAGTKVGQDGLERVFERRLAGTPGGTLFAGTRVLAIAPATAAPPITTTIDPRIERAAVAAMAGRYAGIVAMDPHTGELLALAGVAFSALQPPGSTFKIITATGALEAGIAKPTSDYPVQTQALLDGVPLQNAHGEACGGTLIDAFAVSCNSVFAPLGATLGAARLVAVAERFGFNEPWDIPGAAESYIPSADQIGDALAVGSSAIGQGLVETTALGMTDVAATIAMGGRRPLPTLVHGATPRFVRVTTRHVAAEVRRMMEAVVEYGTGTAAAIPGVIVAGKTGTAELRATQGTDVPADARSPQNTDAWFVGFAPALHPRIVVGALFPEAGAGGDTAAPAVHDVLAAALQR